ncbi:MAG: ECF transporter S component [Tenericutes bacterium]|nr:ECF transporter S component [Mycoplasmatota bacterium]
MLIYFIAGTSLLIALGFMFYLAKNMKEKRNHIIVSGAAILFIITGLTVGLLLGNNDIEVKDVILFNTIILLIYSLFLVVYRKIQVTKTSKKKVMSTKKIAFLGIIIGIASVLMLMGFPVIPIAPYLKVELSALIVFMTLLWFDFKTAVVVSLLTNVIHFFMPSSPPLIPMLDEMVNFLATMLFITPTAVFLNKKSLDKEKKGFSILILTLIGFASTVVLMVLFNQYINLPLVYNIQLSFKEVIAIFGLFNIIKWGINSLVINVTWRRFYILRANL